MGFHGFGWIFMDFQFTCYLVREVFPAPKNPRELILYIGRCRAAKLRGGLQFELSGVVGGCLKGLGTRCEAEVFCAEVGNSGGFHEDFI